MNVILSQKIRHRQAFTLTELLVVIAIIGVLAGLLFPMYGAVTARSKSVQCVSNLRQLGAAFTLYANDHNGDFAVNPDPSDSTFSTPIYFWIGAISPYLGLPPAQTQYSPLNVLKCPAYTPQPSQWHTYTLNGNIYPGGQPPNFYTAHGTRLARISNASHLVLLFDGASGAIADGYPPSGMAGFIVQFRHPGTTANFLMIDGSVTTLAQTSAIATDNIYWLPQ